MRLNAVSWVGSFGSEKRSFVYLLFFHDSFTVCVLCSHGRAEWPTIRSNHLINYSMTAWLKCLQYSTHPTFFTLFCSKRMSVGPRCTFSAYWISKISLCTGIINCELNRYYLVYHSVCSHRHPPFSVPSHQYGAWNKPIEADKCSIF